MTREDDIRFSSEAKGSDEEAKPITHYEHFITVGVEIERTLLIPEEFPSGTRDDVPCAVIPGN